MPFMPFENADEVLNQLFETLLWRNSNNLETSNRWSDFIFDSVHVFYYKYIKVKFRRDNLHIDSAAGWKRKKSNNKSKK